MVLPGIPDQEAAAAVAAVLVVLPSEAVPWEEEELQGGSVISESERKRGIKILSYRFYDSV